MTWRDESEVNTYKLQSLVAEQREVFDCVGGLVQAVGQNASYKLAVNQRHCRQTQSLRQDHFVHSQGGRAGAQPHLGDCRNTAIRLLCHSLLPW